MALQAGIVGLPNVGKSTLFNALTSAGAESANYPFCTIEPNIGMVAVPDARLAEINDIIESQEIIPTSVEIVDIAGLVRGASKGEGLGNQFLGHIRAVDAILHVVRCFDDGDVVHVDGNIDPLRDMETIELELIFADLDAVEKRNKRHAKQAKGGDKESAAMVALCAKMTALLEAGQPVRQGEWNDDELTLIKTAQLLTSKPVLYICNVSEAEAGGSNRYVEIVQQKAAAEGASSVVVSAQIESELAELDAEESAVFLEELGLSEPGLDRMARATYELLGLQTYFTAGPKEIRAWTFQSGWKAPQCAGVIHSDFERGFIRAEVYNIPDLIEYRSEAGLKAAGRLRVEGKAYTVQDGDVMHFLFNV
jgi:GTP-binding protein YchF